MDPNANPQQNPAHQNSGKEGMLLTLIIFGIIVVIGATVFIYYTKKAPLNLGSSSKTANSSNPFVSPTPSYQNPFDSLQSNQTDSSYQNPFASSQ